MSCSNSKTYEEYSLIYSYRDQLAGLSRGRAKKGVIVLEPIEGEVHDHKSPMISVDIHGNQHSVEVPQVDRRVPSAEVAPFQEEGPKVCRRAANIRAYAQQPHKGVDDLVVEPGESPKHPHRRMTDIEYWR